ncbi:hypothetical protein [Desulfosediminicola flagellatus]|uniref:hypothetical protein n=1 Tax=Desulfosediminicola flagellatus TaxID=2569541 RepID=UPI0010AD256D|nr:hypothetical protein [Desulfosediminicola flagellatus]
MKQKTFFHITFLFMFIVCIAHSAHALTEFGQNPFNHTSINSADELKTMLMAQETDIRAGMKKAGIGNVSDALYMQLTKMEVTMAEYGKGQRFPWMFYRKGGKGPVRIDKDVVWESDSNFSVYEFHVDKDGKRYTFVVPPVCGNLTLKTVAPAPLMPKSALKSPTPPTPVATPVVKDPAAAPADTMEDDTKKGQSGFALVADIGYLHQLDPANHLLFRFGIEHAYTDNFSVIGLIGVSPKLDGTESTSALVIDMLANYTFNNAWFAAAGLGGWITDGDSDVDHEDTDLDIILNFGRQIYEAPESYNVQLFVEVRSAVDELDEFDLYGRIGGGVRIRF